MNAKPKNNGKRRRKKKEYQLTNRGQCYIKTGELSKSGIDDKN